MNTFLHRLPRRKRQVLLVGMAALVFVVSVGAGIFVATNKDNGYKPGEAIDGITNELDRSIPEDYQPITFTDVSDRAGIHFQHFSGKRSSQLPEDMGSGAAWGDFDNDGWPDLFVANLVGPLTLSKDEIARSPASCKLYRNNHDGTFTDVTERAGVGLKAMANGAAWADVDNDGYLDLVVTTYGAIVLYKNSGDGTFVDASEQAGVAGYEGFWTGASWADYDRDGHLDLYVTGYVQYQKPENNELVMHYEIENPASINPSSFAPENNLLFHNNGNGTFEEVAVRTGVSNPDGRSLSAAWADFDEDGWVDLYVANDVSDNALYRNLGDGTFEDVSHEAWVADYRGAMGLAVGDWDNDTDQDMVVTHWIAQENALYSNQRAQDRKAGKPGLLRFMDQADQFGIGQSTLDFIGWGTSLIDFDNDGRLDLFITNGSTLQEKDDETKLGAMTSQIFWNGGPEAGFFDVSAVSGDFFQHKYVSRGVAFADYDLDGDVDAFVVNHGGKGVLLRNDGGNKRPWLTVRLDGQAIGAQIRLVADGRTQVRQVGAQSSYCSQNMMAEHFGLGNVTHVDTLEVTWPGGQRRRLTSIPAGRLIHIIEKVRS